MSIEALLFGVLFSVGSSFFESLPSTKKIGRHTAIDFRYGKKLDRIKIEGDSTLYLSRNGENYFQRFAPGELTITDLSTENYISINIQDNFLSTTEELCIKDILIKNRKGKVLQEISFKSHTDYLFSLLNTYSENPNLQNNTLLISTIDAVISFNIYKIFILEREIPTGVIDINNLDDSEYESLIVEGSRIKQELLECFENQQPYRVRKLNSQKITKDEPPMLLPYLHILELNQHDLSPQQLKKQYRKLSKQYHPDTTHGDPHLFDLVQTSYEFLNSYYGY